MVRCIKKYQKVLLITGSAFIMVGLVLPLIVYGIVATQSKESYPKSRCYYAGYDIVEGTCGNGDNYSGLLKYSFSINNNSIVRYIDVYCGHTKDEVITYFKTNYDNTTTWNCWYDRDDPKAGWIGFQPPYDVNGGMMIASGIIISIVYSVLITVYLMIQRRNNHPNFPSYNIYHSEAFDRLPDFQGEI